MMSVARNPLLILLLLLSGFTLLYAYFTIASAPRVAGWGSPENFCVSPEQNLIDSPYEKLYLDVDGRRLVFRGLFVVYMGKGDNMTVDVIPPSAPWRYTLIIKDAIKGSIEANYSQVFPTARVALPVFIAPRSSIYYVDVRAEVTLKTVERSCLVYNIAVHPSKRVDASNIAIAFSIVLVMGAGFVAILRPRARYRGLLGEIVMNTKFMWLWLFTSLTILVAYSTLLNTSPIVQPFEYPITSDVDAQLIALQNFNDIDNVGFLAIYGTMSSVLLTLLFTYRREIGEEKLRDLLPYPRWRRYLATLLTHLILMYIPLYIASVLHLFQLIPHIAVNNPGIFFRYLFHLLILTIFVHVLTSLIPLVVSVLSPRVSLSMLLSVVLYLLLLYETPVTSILFSFLPYMRNFRSVSHYAHSVIFAYLRYPEKANIVKLGGVLTCSQHLYGAIALYIAIAFLLLLVYVRMENP
jgi:hypothetical protein